MHTIDIDDEGLTEVQFLQIVEWESIKIMNGSLSSKHQVAQLLQIPKLLHLDVCSCHITDTNHIQLEKCQLRELLISNNDLSNNILEILWALPQLQTLIMQSCNIKKVPKFKCVDKIRVLDMSYNKFQVGFDNIGLLFNIPSLEELYLQACEILSITNISQQCNIQVLNLSGNKICNNTMQQLSKLTHLNKLFVRNCGFRHIPPLSQSISRLSLSGNRIDDTYGIQSLLTHQNLYDLDLQNCNVTSLGNFNTQQCQVKVLNLNGNPLNAKQLQSASQIALTHLFFDEFVNFTNTVAVFSIQSLESLAINSSSLALYKCKKGGLNIQKLLTYDTTRVQLDVSWLPSLNEFNEVVVQTNPIPKEKSTVHLNNRVVIFQRIRYLEEQKREFLMLKVKQRMKIDSEKKKLFSFIETFQDALEDVDCKQ